jgi:uncharacterized repeat protein (TIGR01451 family)
MKLQFRIALILMLGMFAGTAQADDTGPIRVTSVVKKIAVTTGEDGRPVEELVDPSSVVPGDSVVYTITFENAGDASADNVTITNPVPENLTYESGSAWGPGTQILFSVDGGAEYGPAEALTVSENGEERSAEPRDYTHIRWVMQDALAAGSQGVARFRARLN